LFYFRHVYGIDRWNLYALNFYNPVKFDDLKSMIQGRTMADEEDIEYEEYDAEEYDGVELPEEEVGSEMKPELKETLSATSRVHVGLC